ncbi:hypothetical protein M9458_020875, partial [Cirrhinus mrigala]
DLECFRDYVMEYDYEEKFTVWKPASINDIKKEEPKSIIPTEIDEDTENYADVLNLRSLKRFSDDVEQIDLSILDFDFDDGILPTVETKSPASSDEFKSRNTTLKSFNQINSTEEAGLDNRQSSSKILNESREEASISDSKPEVMSNNETDSIISHFPVVDRKVRSVPTNPINEMESVSTNATLDIEINTNKVENASLSLETDSVSMNATHVENVSSSLETDSVSVNATHVENFSSSLETDSVSVNTTHVENVSSSLEIDSVSVNTTYAPTIETNITDAKNEAHIFPTNTSITSSDAPVGDRNITMEDDSPLPNSSESNFPLSNQTSESKTIIQEEANAKNSSELADGDLDSSGHVFIYQVPSPDSLSNHSETQTEEDFVLLDGGNLLEISTDFKTVVEYNVSPMDTLDEIGELTENTTRIEEVNSTKVNYTSEMFSQINSETESIFNLSSSSPLENSTLQSNESESSNATLSDSSLGLESEITENRTSSTNVTMKPYSDTTSEVFSSKSTENASFSLVPFNVSSSESEEEVVIYLKNNHSEAILTSHLDPKEEQWGYEGKHDLVHREIPEHMNKYISGKFAANLNKPKKKKVVHQRVKPRKGFGMKTKKRKEYKPQSRSVFSPKGFSPRGFAPSGLTPRGTRPVSSEDELMEKSIVIGVPRRDFNDYELYVPKHEQDADFDSIDHHPEEYEYVEYKDPYSKAADVQSPVLDVTSQHFLKMAGDKNTRTYFISVEEEEWDYAGYGQ